MKDRLENRRHRRLRVHYPISFRIVGSPGFEFYDGSTVNISTGGIYFETEQRAFERGDLLKVVLEIPPTAGVMEFGGKVAAYANVLRAETIGNIPADGKRDSRRCGVAACFCRPPRLCL